MKKGRRRQVRRKKTKHNLQHVDRLVHKLAREVEVKHYENASGALNPDNDNGVTICCNDMIQSVVENGRVGDEIETTSILIRGFIQANPLRFEATTVRLILFWDRQANGTQPAVVITPFVDANLTLLDNSNAVTPNFLDFQKFTTIERYTILWDKVFNLNPMSYTAISNPVPPAAQVVTAETPVFKTFQKRIRLGRKCRYNAAANVFTSITTNSLWLAAISSSNATLPTVAWLTRLYYKDA